MQATPQLHVPRPAPLAIGVAVLAAGVGALAAYEPLLALLAVLAAAFVLLVLSDLTVGLLLFVGVSSMMGSVNYLTTIINMRAPGMTMFRLPMTIWAMFITAILQAFALPVLTAAGFMQLLDRTIGTGFFIPDGWTANNTAMASGGVMPKSSTVGKSSARQRA